MIQIRSASQMAWSHSHLLLLKVYHIIPSILTLITQLSWIVAKLSVHTSIAHLIIHPSHLIITVNIVNIVHLHLHLHLYLHLMMIVIAMISILHLLMIMITIGHLVDEIVSW